MNETTHTSGTITLDDLLSTPISEAIPAELVQPYLSCPPWHLIDGAFNFRCVSHPPIVRSSLIYRSGMLAFLTEQGQDQLVKLGIKAIFDLRFNEERKKFPDPKVEGVEVLFADIDASGKSMKGLKWKSLVDMFFFNLEVYESFLRDILLFVLNNPGTPFLVHCTAGKDRSALAIALLLSVAGVPREAIAHDFALTRIGIEPARELLQVKVMAGREVNMEEEALKAIAGCDATSMIQFLEKMDHDFDGGAHGFIEARLGLTADEVEKIKDNLKGE